MIHISEHIKKEREKMGISQEKLARLAEVNYNTLRKIETGLTANPGFYTVHKILRVFGGSIISKNI